MPVVDAVHVVVVPAVGEQLAPAVLDHVGPNDATLLPYASLAVAVKTALPPAVMVEDVVLTAIDATAPGPTATAEDVPVIVLVTVSVAVTVCDPAVLNVTGNVPTPLVSVASAGSAAFASLLVKCTVPVYVVTVLPDESCAVTVALSGVPAVALPAIETASVAVVGAAATETAIEAEQSMLPLLSRRHTVRGAVPVGVVVGTVALKLRTLPPFVY